MGLRSWLINLENGRKVRKLEVLADRADALAEKYAAMSDEQLKAVTPELKRRLKENYETLTDILPDAFAVVREAAARVLNMRHFYVQLLGGIALHQGRIAEMRTGEGKTLVATLPAYLNALTGEGVHVVTVNDYLARRDAEWMGKVHRFLGLTVGVSVSGMEPDEKRKAYQCDITYCTNNELGFDYLRDNMVINREDMVLRGLNYCIIDEVDSILIDEARTPLIISGRGGKSSDMYVIANRFAKSLRPDDLDIDEKKKAVTLTESGIEKAERYYGIENLSDAENTEINHYVNNAIRAHNLMKKDSDYIISDGEIIIVDEFTGRLMIGRRYSDGLHQAIEAKENVRIRNENKTLATITFQNFFRLYKKLSGMTGTAKTEETEFKGIYNLDVVIIPTNEPMIRDDENDVIYTTVKGKYNAILDDIEECYGRGQPVLVGTVSVEKSEELSDLLKKRKIPHNVLNAKNHEREAEIVAQAGKVGAVTVATNMAGRGTDIMLGGNAEYMAKKRMRDQGFTEELISAATSYAATDDAEIIAARDEYNRHFKDFSANLAKDKEKVIELGGLRIIGTERHESRRIDNQLRGRAGRQGDKGSSIFYISLDDDLARLFGGDRLKRIAETFKAEEDTAFSLGMLSRQIENAQRSIEGRNFGIRKHVLEYDDVMNKQREVIYTERNKVLKGENIHGQIVQMLEDVCSDVVNDYCDASVDWDQWDYEGLNREIRQKLIPGAENYLTESKLKVLSVDEVKEYVLKGMTDFYNAKMETAAAAGLDYAEIERVVMLKVVDTRWMDHIDAMDALRRGIDLRAYGNQDPVIAYKREGFEMFDDMVSKIREDVVSLMMRVNIERAPKREAQKIDLQASGGGESANAGAGAAAQTPAKPREIGRNDPCPCGSGKKYKNCCGNK